MLKIGDLDDLGEIKVGNPLAAKHEQTLQEDFLELKVVFRIVILQLKNDATCHNVENYNSQKKKRHGIYTSMRNG